LRIVAITGMPGAGKSTAAHALVPKGWQRVVMGDVIREETRRRGLPADEKNTGEVMKELRKERGEAAVAELCMDTIRKSGSDRVVVDGGLPQIGGGAAGGDPCV
jgi:dephospho-CoA kinase